MLYILAFICGIVFCYLFFSLRNPERKGKEYFFLVRFYSSEANGTFLVTQNKRDLYEPIAKDKINAYFLLHYGIYTNVEIVAHERIERSEYQALLSKQ